jgi:hypothetical protein
VTTTDQPERFYTPYQRRTVVMKLSEKQGIDLSEAGKLFLEMETVDNKKLRKLVDRYAPNADPPMPEEG